VYSPSEVEEAMGEGTTVQVKPGELLPASALVDVDKLIAAYFAERPDPGAPAERVRFGTSGHRGSAFRRSFNEWHILAIAQAICDYRRAAGIDGPLFLGRDTHALSEPAAVTALEVLAANGVEVWVDEEDSFTPTPVVSHAILGFNRGRESGLADGILVTPSHNPPEDGGLKYNEPHGGAADTKATAWIERRANELLADQVRAVRRISLARAKAAGAVRPYAYAAHYVADLDSALDLEAVRAAGLRLGADPMGGAALRYWQHIAAHYRLQIDIVNETIDPTFRFMPADWDGRIRMDCSSPFAMSGLVRLRDRFDLAFGNDTDADRHGIVTRAAGLMNPNHYLSVALWYLLQRRPAWPAHAGVGKTVVTTHLIDRLTAARERVLFETPVGFKWFVTGLWKGALVFAGEESAGASFLRKDGTVWSTDKDGILLALLAAEMTAREQRDPAELYEVVAGEWGRPAYERVDAPASAEQKEALLRLDPNALRIEELAGEPVEQVLNRAPGNGEPIGGIKVVARNGWFAARPSGTEDVYKLYAESFLGEAHLRAIQEQAQSLLASVLESAGGKAKE
jgi:phosphoglucomutase